MCTKQQTKRPVKVFCRHCRKPICFKNDKWVHCVNGGETHEAEVMEKNDAKKTVSNLDREYALQQRQGLLLQVDALERRWGISPRTSELRKAAQGDNRLLTRSRGK